jgi:hypothetical protein
LELDTTDGDELLFEEYAVKIIAQFGTADADRSGMLERIEFATIGVVRKPSHVARRRTSLRRL